RPRRPAGRYAPPPRTRPGTPQRSGRRGGRRRPSPAATSSGRPRRDSVRPVSPADKARMRSDRSGLDVEPTTSGTEVADALAPHADGLAGGRDGDLAVVAVDLIERAVAGGVGMDVGGGASGSVGDLQGCAPGEPAVDRAPIPDVPVVGSVGLLEITVRRLHVPQAIVTVPGSHDARLRRILTVDGDAGRVAPTLTLVRGDRHVARLGTSVDEWPLVREHQASVRVGRDRRLSRVELAAPEREAVLSDRHLGDDDVLP